MLRQELDSGTAIARWIVPFSATIFAMLTLQMSSLGFSPLLPAIQSDFDITYSQMGLFTGVYGLVAIAMSIPGGWLANRFGERRVMAVGLAIVALGLVLLSLAPNFPSGLTARVVWIVGYRIAFVSVMTAIALTVPDALRSRAMGILGAVAALASVIGAPFGSAIGESFGWRRAMVAYALMAALGGIVFWLCYRQRSGGDGSVPVHVHGPHGAPASGEAGKSPYRRPAIWAMVLLGLVNMGGFSATFFVPSAVQATFGLAAMDAAYIISIGYTTAIFANLLVGYLGDRFNRFTVLAALMLIVIPASLVMTTDNLLVFQVATALVISLGLAATNQVYAAAGEIARRAQTGSVMGIVSLGGGIFGFLGPQLLGVLRDWSGGFAAGWYFVAGGAVVALVVILFLKGYSASLQRAAAAAGEAL